MKGSAVRVRASASSIDAPSSDSASGLTSGSAHSANIELGSCRFDRVARADTGGRLELLEDVCVRRESDVGRVAHLPRHFEHRDAFVDHERGERMAQVVWAAGVKPDRLGRRPIDILPPVAPVAVRPERSRDVGKTSVASEGRPHSSRERRISAASGLGAEPFGCDSSSSSSRTTPPRRARAGSLAPQCPPTAAPAPPLAVDPRTRGQLLRKRNEEAVAAHTLAGSRSPARACGKVP